MVVCSKNNCIVATNAVDSHDYILCWLCDNAVHVKCAGYTGRIKESIAKAGGLKYGCGGRE